MPSSDRQPGRIAVLVMLLVANVAMLALWPWRERLAREADSGDRPFFVRSNGDVVLMPVGIIRNAGYLRWFLHAVQADRRVLFFGTSESNIPYNIGAQLNALRPNDPGLVVLAKAGLSPIHQCLVFARCEAEGLSVPPMILIINLVYFTSSHDVINDGWLSGVTRTPSFMQMDHGNLSRYLTPDVRRAYDAHFIERAPLFPMHVQEYLGNLLYLRFHEATPEDLDLGGHRLAVPVYAYNGAMREYDPQRAVPKGFEAPDQLAKGRWSVSPPDSSLNLKGLECSLAIFKKQAAPVLVIILPTNKTFYAFNGLDMEEYDARYAEIRRRIASAVQSENIHVLDLYNLKLDLGFEDRMHADAYGNFQLVKYIARSPDYARFIHTVREYYRTHPVQPRECSMETRAGWLREPRP